MDVVVVVREHVMGYVRVAQDVPAHVQEHVILDVLIPALRHVEMDVETIAQAAVDLSVRADVKETV